MKDDTKPRQELILDAVERCFQRYGIQKTTLADVAEEAGTSRMTLYREFKDKQALFDKAFLRNVHRHWLQIAAALESVIELDDWLVEAVVYFKRNLADDRTLRLYAKLGAFEHGLTLALTPAGLAPVVLAMQSRFDAALTQGRLAQGIEPEDIAEWAHRMNHSLIAIPGERLQDIEKLRRWLRMQVSGGIVSH